MSSWEYKVVYMDFRGRASVEGDESFIAKEERRSAFARRVMNSLGAEGWEMVGVQPLWPAETSYLIFKREGVGDSAPPAGQEPTEAAPNSGKTERLPNAPEAGADAGAGEAQGPPPTVL
jgi:hypothetical protein